MKTMERPAMNFCKSKACTRFNLKVGTFRSESIYAYITLKKSITIILKVITVLHMMKELDGSEQIFWQFVQNAQLNIIQMIH